jgi:hypothetical protein
MFAFNFMKTGYRRATATRRILATKIQVDIPNSLGIVKTCKNDSYSADSWIVAVPKR